jgi:hypothetical protein
MSSPPENPYLREFKKICRKEIGCHIENMHIVNADCKEYCATRQAQGAKCFAFLMPKNCEAGCKALQVIAEDLT